MWRAALLLLVLGVVHDFVWQAFPDDMQGDVRQITMWALLVATCFVTAGLSRWDPLVSAAATAVVVMNFTSAMCSLWWLIDPWVRVQGEEQCTAKWGNTSLLVSGIAALSVFAWRRHKYGR